MKTKLLEDIYLNIDFYKDSNMIQPLKNISKLDDCQVLGESLDKPKRKYVYYPDAAKRYNDKEEVKEKRTIYYKEYSSRPEFKEMKKEYNKRYQVKAKLKRQEEKELLAKLLMKEKID